MVPPPPSGRTTTAIESSAKATWRRDRTTTPTRPGGPRRSGLAGVRAAEVFAFYPTMHFGLLGAVTLASALYGDLVILPALVAIFWKREPSPAADAPDRERALEDAIA